MIEAFNFMKFLVPTQNFLTKLSFLVVRNAADVPSCLPVAGVLNKSWPSSF